MFGKYFKQENNGKGSGCDQTENLSIVSRGDEEQQLNLLYSKSRSGMWGMFIYLLISAFAYHFKEQSLATILPADVMSSLGAVPPVFMASCILWLSTISALIIIAGRLYHGTKPSATIVHLSFRAAFYLLFFTVGGLSQCYNTIFISGIIVMTLQHYNVLAYYTKRIEIDFTTCNCH